MLQGHPWEALRLCCLFLPLHYVSLYRSHMQVWASYEWLQQGHLHFSPCVSKMFFFCSDMNGAWYNPRDMAQCSQGCMLLRLMVHAKSLLLVREMVHRFRSYGLFWWELESETDVKSHESILTLQTPGQLANWLAWTPGHMLHSSMQAIPPTTKHSLEQCFPEPSVMTEIDAFHDMWPLSRWSVSTNEEMNKSNELNMNSNCYMWQLVAPSGTVQN